MHSVLLHSLLVLAFSTLANSLRAQECGTPVECYEKAIANLQEAEQLVETQRSQIETAIAGAAADIQQLKDRLQNAEANLVPKATVAFFQLKECPLGWAVAEYARGRVIVGSGNVNNQDRRGVKISNWEFGIAGGEESHTLTVEEMPKHRHLIELYGLDNYVMSPTPNRGVHPGDVSGSFDYSVASEASGDSRPHNNMPPFIALTPCVKQ